MDLFTERAAVMTTIAVKSISFDDDDRGRLDGDPGLFPARDPDLFLARDDGRVDLSDHGRGTPVGRGGLAHNTRPAGEDSFQTWDPGERAETENGWRGADRPFGDQSAGPCEDGLVDAEGSAHHGQNEEEEEEASCPAADACQEEEEASREADAYPAPWEESRVASFGHPDPALRVVAIPAAVAASCLEGERRMVPQGKGRQRASSDERPFGDDRPRDRAGRVPRRLHPSAGRRARRAPGPRQPASQE